MLTVKQLKKIIDVLPDNTVVLCEYNDVETAIIEYHSDGRTHISLTNCE